MKPAWDKLIDAYEGSSSVIVADVDCTSDEGQSVCTDNNVEGYPTIKYFTDETGKSGEDYGGGRDFDELDKFVKEKLAKKCNPATKEDCDDQEKAYIDKMQAKGVDKIKSELERLDHMKGADMKADKKQWLMKRIAVLKGLAGGKSEL